MNEFKVNYLMNLIKRLVAFFGLSFLCLSVVFAQQKQGVTIGGYGELHYNDVTYNANERQTSGTLDFHRFALIAGYEFNDWISFHSELELKHTLLESEESGTLALNQAYIDMELQPEFGIRAGLLLIPAGIINLNYRPSNFHGVERPNVGKFMIPTTWRESGIGVYGNTSFGLSYKAYAMAGLKPNGITGENGIREARQNGFGSSTSNLAFITRVDFKITKNLQAGASYYISTLNNKIEDGNVEHMSSLDEAIYNMGEGHVWYKGKNFEGRGIFIFSRILDVNDLNDAFGNAAGQMQVGGYIELAYNILPFFIAQTKQQLYAFARGESYDTNFFTGDIPRNNEFLREELTVGFTYKPAPRVALKTDYQFLTSLGSKHIEQLNLGIGYSF